MEVNVYFHLQCGLGQIFNNEALNMLVHDLQIRREYDDRAYAVKAVGLLYNILVYKFLPT